MLPGSKRGPGNSAGNPFTKRPRETEDGASDAGHAELNRRARDLGREIVKLARKELGGHPLSRKAHEKSFLEKVAESKGSDKFAKIFNERWRRRVPKHDEFVSTSTVREMVIGILEEIKNDAELNYFSASIDEISEFRALTGHVGNLDFNHPSSLLSALWRVPAETASEHASQDLRRKKLVLDEVEKLLAKPGVKSSEIIAKMIAVATTYTLNNMYWPITAKNLFRGSIAGHKDDYKAAIEAARKREAIKDEMVARYGVLQTPGTRHLTSPFTGDTKPGWVSSKRLSSGQEKEQLEALPKFSGKPASGLLKPSPQKMAPAVALGGAP
jgi:hypothetical protein